MTIPLRVNLAGDDRALAGALAEWPELARPPAQVTVDYEPVTADWKRALVDATEHVSVTWTDGAELFRWPGTVVYIVLPDLPIDAATALARLAPLPWQLASFPPLGEAGDRSFGDGMGSLGWACAFRGDGHARVVSRRWLDEGPWRVVRGAHDTTLVQFHDLAASPELARAQAEPGHELLGISDTGGFLQRDYIARHRIAGDYDGRRVLVDAGDRDVDPIEMRDACAARARGHDDAGHPIASAGFRFARRGDAERHLRALWLRELECWSPEGRHDLDYRPVHEVPPWVTR